jgi:hypothetical protein
MPGRVEGETAFEATGLLAIILEFSVASYFQNGGMQGSAAKADTLKY